MGAFVYRLMGAAALDASTYEVLEADRRATPQAVIVVVLSSLAAGFGAGGWNGPSVTTLLIVTALALATWIAWAFLILQIGDRFLREPRTEVNTFQLLRTVGFAASPGLLQVFALFPLLTVPVFAGTWLWMLAAMVVAVRQALDYSSTRRALLACAIALCLVISAWLILALASTRTVTAECDLVWIDAAGRPSSAALDALVLLDDAELDGLDPEDYGVTALRARSTALDEATALTSEAVRFDADLTAAMLRFLRDLHAGRVDAKALGVPDMGEADEPDYGALLRRAATSGRLLPLVDALTPDGRQYRAIRRELARYRELALQRDWSAALSRLPCLVPGESGDLDALRAWLVGTGDLSPQSPDPHAGYSGAIVDAVRRFQTRHGLTPDGIIGAATMTALRTPIATRIRQLELALERLRWLPALGPGRLVAINIPMFRLWAWDRPDSATPPDLAMNAVVGRAVAAERPALFETMTYVALGPFSIEFAVPNERHAFMYGTSAPEILADPRRNLSPGCIRIEDPVALAAWALRGLDEWSADAIARTAPTVVSRRIDLLRPARVLIYYATAAVFPDDGLLHFSEDIYGRDQALDRAVRGR